MTLKNTVNLIKSVPVYYGKYEKYEKWKIWDGYANLLA